MKHNLLKSVILSVILLMGVSNAWAGAGIFYGQINLEKDGGEYIAHTDNYSTAFALGNIQNLSIDATYSKVWKENGGDITSSTLCYKLYSSTKEFIPATSVGMGWLKDITNTNDQEWGKTGINSNLTSNLVPGESYTLEFWFKAEGRESSTSSSTTFWLSNNRNNYKVTFTYTPRYNITYRDQGNKAFSGTHADNYPTTHIYGTATTLKTATKNNYTFQGWYTDQECTNKVTSLGATAYTNNITLYAQWEGVECKISLNAGTNNYFLINSQKKSTIYAHVKFGTNTIYKYTSGSNQTIGTEIILPYKKGHSCTGFGQTAGTCMVINNKGELLSDRSYNILKYTDKDGNWNGSSASTLDSYWTANKYDIKFEAPEGYYHASYGLRSIEVTYDQQIPEINEYKNSDGFPKRNGYAFDGYYTIQNGQGTKYYDKDGYRTYTNNWDSEEGITLYANFTLETYSITYELNGGTNHANNPNSYTYEYATITLQEPTKTGYTFNGWYDNSSFTDTPITQISKGSYGNKTLYAKWTANTYTVTLDQQSGTGGTASVTATYGAAMPAITKPTRNGYTFGGYYTAINGGGTQYYNANGASSINWDKTATTTLYAKWTANQSTITWNANGGSVTPASSTYTYDGDPVALPTPTRTGYEFNGWFTASTGGTKISDVGKTNKPTSNTTYYAQWKAKTYIVTLDPQGGFSGSNSINATYDAKLPAITPPTRDGYMFNGYYSQPSGQGTKYYNTDGTSTLTWNQENATLYAYWAEYSKCIFFKNNVGWNNVYIYTFTNNAWFNEINGDNKQGVNPQVNKLEHGKMTKIDNQSDIYYYILTNTTDGFNYVAFSEGDMRSYTTFHKSKASYRGDRTDKMPLFIPLNTINQTQNETSYYNEGVWMKYNSKESGYYLNIAGESSTPLVAANAGDYTFTATVYLTPGQRILDLTNLYPDTKFSKDGSLTSGTSLILDKWQEYSADSKLSLSTTNEGAYTFTLNLADGQVKLSAAYPSVVTPEAGDYRLLYVEQVVEKSIANGDEWKTVITRKKAHPSDIIKKGTPSQIVSLHVYNKNTYQAVKNPKATNNEDKYYTSPSNSAVILQQYNGTTWEDKEHHMVFGPMETLPAMAMLPGRRNTEGNAILKYDDGIPAIQKDTKYNGNGVWNFPVIQSGNSDAILDREHIERYSGKYYIRTANSVGGWENYTIPENHMTHSSYAEQSNEFTHYYCKWIDKGKNGSAYVQFVVANDFGQAISDTLIADRATLFGVPLAENEKMVTDNGLLPANANVRFSWKEENNALHRAYLDGSGSSKEYLVLTDLGHKIFKFKDKENYLTNDTATFLDNGGWMYQVDVYSKTNSPINLTAKYNGKTQYFKGEAARATTNLIGGNIDDETKYPIRILYDFKENHLITGYVPQVPETKDVAINTNLMMIRKNHGAANQLTMNLNSEDKDGVAVNTGYDAYGVLTFTEDHLKGTDNWKVTNDKTFYWISFPFDVNLKDAFGFGKYAYHWYIEYYDGAARAENGLFLDSGTYWEYVMEEDADNFELHANQGYVLWLNVAQIQADGFFTDITKEISIYFPAANKIDNNFQTRSETINLPAQRRPEGSRRYEQDSNWRLIGVPSYANTAATTTQSDINFVYVYDAATNKYKVTSTINDLEGDCFQSMHAYMVQYEGDINWTTVVNEYPSQLAARQNSNSTKEQHVLRLELLRNGSKEDHTYIQLQDDKATDMFDMNLDLTKMSGSGGNIYSIIPSTSDPIQAAANVMPIEECIIPLGIKTTKATNYTFAMPDGTDGIVVELIDYENNTRTNMLLDNYTVNLGKGTFENRFALHVKPSKVTTSVEDVNTNTMGVKKYLIDGVLYMQKDGVLYDAQGKLVR